MDAPAQMDIEYTLATLMRTALPSPMSSSRCPTQWEAPKLIRSSHVSERQCRSTLCRLYCRALIYNVEWQERSQAALRGPPAISQARSSWRAAKSRSTVATARSRSPLTKRTSPSRLARSPATSNSSQLVACPT